MLCRFIKLTTSFRTEYKNCPAQQKQDTSNDGEDKGNGRMVVLKEGLISVPPTVYADTQNDTDSYKTINRYMLWGSGGAVVLKEGLISVPPTVHAYTKNDTDSYKTINRYMLWGSGGAVVLKEGLIWVPPTVHTDTQNDTDSYNSSYN